MRFCWHGSGSYSLMLAGVEILVDPSFSKRGEYGPWFIPNENAPEFSAYLAAHCPDLVLITHGHFDHFDLHTVGKLAAGTRCVFASTAEVCHTISAEFAVSRTRLAPLAARQPVTICGLRATAIEGVHWFTGEEGARAARRLAGRPDRYGVMPCGGPMYSYVLEGNRTTVYLSGDTLEEGIPELPVDVAILNMGSMVQDPVTKQPAKAVIDLPEAARAVERLLKPAVVVPVHFDLGVFLEKIDPRNIASTLAGTAPRPTVVVAPYNQWIEIEPRG